MGFNKYLLNIIVRSILIAITALLMMLFAVKLKWFFTFIFLCLLFIFQIFLLIRYVSKINRDLANFLIHLKEQNTSLNLSGNHIDSIFGNLSSELNRINEEFKKIENEKIRKQNFLDILLNRVGTGILVISELNKVILHNNALENILGIEDNSSENLKIQLKKVLNDYSKLNPGEQNITNIRINNITRRVLITLSEIRENNSVHKIYTFHDIDREMTDYELQSWNGLIKVLSHEIMNTLTPISTTVDTLKDCLTVKGANKTLDQIEEHDVRDAVKGVTLMENRVTGLQDFIKRFRRFLDIPVPELNHFDLIECVKNISDSYKDKVNIQFDHVDKFQTLFADKSLIDLVLINIFKNSIEAGADNIELNLYKAGNNLILKIKDNGKGIPPSTLQKAFLPFYTTKNGGSGIGLSLSRQIMYAHKGNIELYSDDTGTFVKLIFPLK